MLSLSCTYPPPPTSSISLFLETQYLFITLNKIIPTPQYESVAIPFRVIEAQINQHQLLELGSIKQEDAAFYRVFSARRKEAHRASRQNLHLQPSTPERCFILSVQHCNITCDIRPPLPQSCLPRSHLPRTAFSQDTRSDGERILPPISRERVLGPTGLGSIRQKDQKASQS